MLLGTYHEVSQRRPLSFMKRAQSISSPVPLFQDVPGRLKPSATLPDDRVSVYSCWKGSMNESNTKSFGVT